MMDSVELAGFVLSLAMVYCNIRQIHWGWLLTILSSVLYGYVFWKTALYGQAALQVMFIVMAVWGWQKWLQGRSQSAASADMTVTDLLPISSLQRHEWQRAGVATLLAWSFCTVVLQHFSDSKVVGLDALITALALLGQYLLGQKKIETWWVWLAVNILTVALMVTQNLWLTALLYFVFAVLSVVGLKAWRKQHAH
ncbi:nicotinamide riboside transporter PnuC [Limnohabitans sp. Rim11]|jgi:nicotinamide mononucleotide transporter|uniref:nicotinamide riboside transporter PnuC n=1 Tax=Limnohabitans sp. Rim11 TaxID=1100719 RepID=UPI000A561533|nr:nicotinamide riboside transporter PnuC [Limnohabitans sp. Rim11]